MNGTTRFVVEVGAEKGWVPKYWCDTMAKAESRFEDYAGGGELVRILDRSVIVKQGGGPQGYSPHPGLQSTTEAEPSVGCDSGMDDRLNEARYVLMVSDLSLTKLNAIRTFLQSMGLHCAVENYRDPLRDEQPG